MDSVFWPSTAIQTLNQNKKGLRILRSPKSDRRGSNPRSRPWQGRALPTTPLSHKRVMGIEPTYPAWKAGVLPLNYTRKYSVERAIDGARTRGLDLGKVARYQLRHYRISGWWESNPRIQLGRLVFYHWTTPAQLVVCASLSHQRRLVYMMKLYLSTLNLNFFYFFNNIYKSSSGKQFVTQIKSSVSLLSSIPNNCYAVYQKELSLLLI